VIGQPFGSPPFQEGAIFELMKGHHQIHHFARHSDSLACHRHHSKFTMSR
jgi:hypothetical protein